MWDIQVKSNADSSALNWELHAEGTNRQTQTSFQDHVKHTPAHQVLQLHTDYHLVHILLSTQRMSKGLRRLLTLLKTLCGRRPELCCCCCCWPHWDVLWTLANFAPNCQNTQSRTPTSVWRCGNCPPEAKAKLYLMLKLCLEIAAHLTELSWKYSKLSWNHGVTLPIDDSTLTSYLNSWPVIDRLFKALHQLININKPIIKLFLCKPD